MHRSLFFFGLILLMALSACGQTSGSTDIADVSPQPTSTISPIEPTLTAEPTLTPEESILLPHRLYYLAQDSNSIIQVFCLDRDGTSISQKTFEPSDVVAYDVSPLDGKLAFVSKNNLFIAENDGTNRIVLFEGSTIETDADRKIRTIQSPRWSPDGQTLSFSYEGLNLYTFKSENLTKLLNYELSQTVQLLWTTYIPHSFSPNGKKILVDVSKYEGGTVGIFDVTTGEFKQAEESIYADSKHWSADNSAVFIAEDTTSEYTTGGLWRLNASNGNVATLFLSGFWEEPPANLANCPYLGTDGKLYFFSFSDPNEYVSRSPLKLVRTNADGVTGYEELLANTFEPRECLWSTDASMVVITQSDEQGDYPATLVYSTGENVVQLLPDAKTLTWGP